MLVPARVAGPLVTLLTIGVREGRRRGVPVDMDMVVVLDAIHEAAERWEQSVGAASGTTGPGENRVGLGNHVLLSVATSAARAERSERAIRKACSERRLRAKKSGRDWQIAEEDLDDYRFGRRHDRRH